MKKTNQMYTVLSRIAFAGLASLLIVACSNSFFEKRDSMGSFPKNSSSTGTLTIKISTAGDGSRTILPQAISAGDIKSFTVLLERDGYDDLSYTKISNLSVPIPNLAIGEWNLTVSGFDVDNKKITEGLTAVTVSAGSCDATVILTPIRTADGTGKLDVKFTYTGAVGDIGQSSVVLTKYPVPNPLTTITIPENDFVISTDFKTITINTSIPSGTYMLTINLARDVASTMVAYPPIKNIVQMYDNRISSAIINVDSAQLTQPPAAPTNLTIRAFDGTKLTLAWGDNSDVEEEYILSFNGVDGVQLSAGTQTYKIPPPATQSTFTVRAVNKYGSSTSAPLTYIPPTGISLDRTTLVLSVGKDTELIATLSPPGASLAPFIQWSSSDPAVATVSDGLVTGVTTSVTTSGNAPVGIQAYFSGNVFGSISATAQVTVVDTWFSSGTGTKNDPYLVTTVEELELVRYALMSSFKQTSHIAFPFNFEWTPIGMPDAPFTGTYNGNGKLIKNLNIQSTESLNVGLFGVTAGATLQNIGLADVTISMNEPSPDSLGALVGSATETTILRCFSNGSTTSSTTGSNIGGLVGSLTGGSIKESWSSANPSGVESVGGLIGMSSGATIENCYARGFVYGTGDLYKIAGLVGSATGGTIKNCFSAASVSVGGQGFAGSPLNPNIESSYWDTGASGVSTSSGGGADRSTSDMKQAATFVDWNFGTTWFINPEISYPYLHRIAVEGTKSPFVLITSLSPGDEISFGDVHSTGVTNKEMTFTMYNNGSNPLTPQITLSNTPASAYTVVPPAGGGSIPVNDSRTFTVILTHSLSLSPTDTLTISSDDPDTPDAPDFVLNLTGSFCE